MQLSYECGIYKLIFFFSELSALKTTIVIKTLSFPRFFQKIKTP